MEGRPSRLGDLHEQRNWGVKGHGTQRHTVLGDISEVLSEQSYHCRFTSSCVHVGSRKTTSPPGGGAGTQVQPDLVSWVTQSGAPGAAQQSALTRCRRDFHTERVFLLETLPSGCPHFPPFYSF